MKVKDLIDYLKELDGDLVVYGMSDDEGNNTANIYPPSIRYTIVKKGEEVQEHYLNIEDIFTNEDMEDMGAETFEEYLNEYFNNPEDYEVKQVVIL